MITSSPPFPTDNPQVWDELTLHAANIYLEAEGEPYDGKLAVGYVVRNRTHYKNLPYRAIILAPMQFSGWNLPDRKYSLSRLQGASGHNAIESWKAASSSCFRFEPDPTDGADHYLNVDLVRKMNDGNLPRWANEAMVNSNIRKVEIGQHTFFRLNGQGA